MKPLNVLKRVQNARAPVCIAQLKRVVIIFYPVIQVIKLHLQGIIAIGVALPSSPGFFGVFEAAAKVGLAVYSVPGGQAVTWAIGFHILSFIPITLFGLYYFARLGLHFSDFQSQPNER